MSQVKYHIIYKGSAAKELRKLDKEAQRRLLMAIETLGITPRPDGVKKLKARFNQYRIRVGSYRVVYEIRDEQLLVLVLRVAHRRDVYH
ncbi:type II toxin-antitoxin system RelE family toxin [Corynebacterium pyruviciproducens]|uniref:RelE/StbE family addiction module toxin n=1 Tax=Corynebacterium pyruviciproducens ATCC BAA-1742 TaxID=1125779 RepID=S2ZET5_9CORY|nr:type II toxin-antitoxin system RelE/ParE family toxin [Corynebacterium pyruviciproducens]EPD68532.1 hypothetical protein HMPREF1219_01713 [Corynebacterium pyruviciproducens ATCC BAA-1742]MDK7215190.1 type II toxin-antitoxin system RelE/ParE family toxin [Corynebacterium pyruviciproducens]